ncbi:MAG TPA: glycosyltransferase, partial [Fibrobacteria bacterium]|nr:glycosyltransferase [Fibrobacteria bacterium]
VRHRVAEANRRLVAPRPEDLTVRKEPIRTVRPYLLQGLWRSAKDAWVRARLPGIIRRFGLDGYDVVHFDGARDLTHGAHLARELKRRGARIVSVFYGTELRVEGVTPALDALTDLSITMEFDHRFLHPDIFFMPAPFEMPEAPRKTALHSPLRVVHAPSHRYNKGTDLILPVIDRLKARFDFEFVLVEGKTQEECRRIKWDCDLCIDQVGNRGGTGYGVSSLEMLAAGIPCVSDFTKPLADFLPGHPFHLADPGTLEEVLAGILADPDQILARGEAGRRWVEETHGHKAIHDRLVEGYRKAGIL